MSTLASNELKSISSGKVVEVDALLGKKASLVKFNSVSDMISGVDSSGDDVAFVIGQCCSTGNTLWVVLSILEPVTISSFKCLGDSVAAGDLGFSYDGVTDNLSVFNDAKSLLSGSNLGIDFNENGTIYISSSRPDLTGISIKSNPGAVIKVDANPNVNEMTLETDLNINNTAHETTLIKERNTKQSVLIGGGAAIRNRGSGAPEKIEFGDTLLASITSINTFGAFTGADNTTYLSWGVSFASGQEGAFVEVEEGYLFEVAFRHIGLPVGSSSSFRGVAVLSGEQRVDFSVFPGQAIAKKVVQGVANESEDYTLPNGGAYSLGEDGAVYLGVRVVDGGCEFYINGTIFAKHEMSGKPVKIGFLTSFFESSQAQILNLTKTFIEEPVSSAKTKIAIVGDSISYGAWSSVQYDEIIKKTMQHAGIGEIESINYAVSGSSSASWIAGGSEDITTKDFDGVDYCLVMLGTNDVQGDVSGITFEANIRSIIAHLEGINVRPIIGVFPMWTTVDVSGVTGVTTSNYAKGGWHRQLVKYIGADTSVPVADVCAEFGSNIDWLGDNIHPKEEGLLSVASAFAAAIIKDASGKNARVKKKNIEFEVSGGWSAIALNQPPQYSKIENMITMSGVVTGGVLGATIATLPSDVRPELKRSFSCLAVQSGGVVGTARVDILSGGEVNIQDSAIIPLVVYLDNITYTI